MTRFGVSATLTQWAKGAYDSATAAHAAGSTTNTTVTVVVADYDVDEIDGSLVQRDDKQVFMGGADGTPEIKDSLTINSVVFEIIRIKEIKPADVVVAYQMQVRK